VLVLWSGGFAQEGPDLGAPIMDRIAARLWHSPQPGGHFFVSHSRKDRCKAVLPRGIIHSIMTTATISVADPPPSPQISEPRPALSRQKSPRFTTALIFLAALSGALHGLAWLFPDVWYCAWGGQIGLICLGFLTAPRAAFALGFLVGAIGTGSAFYWGIDALDLTMDASKSVAFALYSVLIAAEAVGFAIFCGGVSRIARGGRRAYWLIPFLWAAIDCFYPRIFAWKLGYSQLEWLDLIQVAELVGSDGIGFIITAVCAIPAIWLFADRRGVKIAYASVAAALLASTLLFGAVRRHQWDAWTGQQSKFKVALIQVDPVFVGSEEKLRQRSLAVHDQVDLVCWPETAIGTYSEELTHFRDLDHSLNFSRESHANLEPAKDFHCHLLAGGKLYSAESSHVGPYHMAAFLISPAQDVLGWYKKRTLLPLGEYVPGQSYFPSLRRWMTIEHIIHPGTDPNPLLTSDGTKLGVLMCYEDTIPRNARHTAAAGAEILISLIQGTAFENPLTLIQHERLARLRAVENRRFFVRCSSTGITCAISPSGAMLDHLTPQTEGTLIAELPLVASRTGYQFVGEAFGWISALLCIASLVLVKNI
jgi:apolipoprotein N-acyltransferase